MAPKFDQHKAKHTLIHVSLSLITILMCLTHIQRGRNWENIGKFWNSLIVLFLFLGELTKVGLAKYFGRHEKDTITSKTKKKEYIPIIKDLLGGLLFQGICTILYAFTCIILGAPVLTNYEQTFVISTLLTLLTVSPTVFLIGVSGTLQVVFCEKADFLKKSEETAVNLYKYNAAGAIFGAWAGSVVVPLDWDRDWQNYPIPNVIGALLGCGLANIFVCTTVLFTTAKLYLNKKRM